MLCTCTWTCLSHHEIIHTQVYVDQVTEEIVAVTRHSPSTHQSVILMAHTAYNHPQSWAIPTLSNPYTRFEHVPPLTVPGKVTEVVLEARLVKKDGIEGEEFQQSDHVLNGLETHVVEMRSHISLGESHMCRLAGEEGGTQEVVFTDFCPGSVIAFRSVLYMYMYSTRPCTIFLCTCMYMYKCSLVRCTCIHVCKSGGCQTRYMYLLHYM